MTQDVNPAVQASPPESFEQFLETSSVGYIYAQPDGKIIRVSTRIAKWLNTEATALAGTNIIDHFSVAGKIYFQTHLVPLLKMQGFFEEIALELAPANAPRVPVMVNGIEQLDESVGPKFLRLAILPLVERRQYERNLLSARSKAEGDLSQERQTGGLREQFIAVLGHDLRNPLAAIDGAVRLLRKTPLNERAIAITGMMVMSVGRMASLIDDVMDFARGRLGSGIELKRLKVNLVPVLAHAVEELQIGAPTRKIETVFDLPAPVNCDASRVAQLLSNLLANALTHGAADGPVVVQASQANGVFELSVGNRGEAIPSAAMERLFQPFTREDVRPSQQGLGLGLYIASEIAKAHGGTLTVSSTDEMTRFTFTAPLG
jgi:sigma-B regulation protein RsbU (phosphoserine phosphatase)